MSAYACEPERGSEPGAGWAWACAAAQNHHVWVLTHDTNRDACTSALAGRPDLAGKLHFEFLRNPRWVRPLRSRAITKRLYYIVWQLTTYRATARRLHSRVRFDVEHHVTYASDWLPVGAGGLVEVPLVWGPVGGAATTGGLRLWVLLGPRGLLTEAIRTAMLHMALMLSGRRVARRAAMILAQNGDVARAFAGLSEVIVQPNIGLSPSTPSTRKPHHDDPPVAIFAGRLQAWKGLRPALLALRLPEAAGWRFHIYGDGVERQRLGRAVARWGLDERVTFFGSRPRAEVQAALAEADVMLFPSIHDAAGWSVAEAIEAGCPVVALDVGGPPTLMGPDDGVVVPVDGGVVTALAGALDRARRCSPTAGRWSADRLPGVVDDVYRRVSYREHAGADVG